MLFLIPFCHGELLININIDSDCFDYRYVFVIVVIGNKNGCFFFTWLLCRSGTESLKLNVLEIIIFRDVVFGLMCHTRIKRGSPIVDPTVEVQSRKTELVLILI